MVDAKGHRTEYTYHPGSYQLTSLYDVENQVHTTYSYYPDWRAESVTGPPTASGSAETVYSYPSPNVVEQRVKRDASSWITTRSSFDALGRPSSTELLNGCPNGGTIRSEIRYDQMSRPYEVTNPHCTNKISTTDGATLHAGRNGEPGYDVLGRPLFVSLPDSGVHSWMYSGRTVSETDEAGHQWKRTYDG